MKRSSMHLHLNPVGGISGNMFIGAILDTFPDLAARLPEQMVLAGFDRLVTLSSSAHTDGILTGTWFDVQENLPVSTAAVFNPLQAANSHGHRLWRDIRARLQDSQLEPGVLRHALGIFAHLAEAEAAVHGMPVEEVAFHEVGAWDSIADIVCAAWLIEACGDCSWSVSSLPAGRGLVKSAHGDLPLPAPAVLRLLKGFAFHDDQREGERVTPTGAAILRYLQPLAALPAGQWQLQHSGTGFGSKRFAGISNVLRIQAYTTEQTSEIRDVICVLSFVVDDQNPESLALAVDSLRVHNGVVDVVQTPVFGKKNRIAQQLDVLCEPAHQHAIAQYCLSRTSTLGIRVRLEERIKVARRMVTVMHGDRSWRVKLALRPNGHVTAKAELDDLRGPDLALGDRDTLKHALEQAALEQAETAFSDPGECHGE